MRGPSLFTTFELLDRTEVNVVEGVVTDDLDAVIEDGEGDGVANMAGLFGVVAVLDTNIADPLSPR